MGEINKIGGFGRVDRNSPSDGHDQLEIVHKRSQQQQPQRNSKVDEVAKLYEKQFLREMVKAMRGTVDPSGLTKPSMGEGIYRDQLDNEYVEVWGEKGGIGLSQMIYDQIMDRYFSNQQALRKEGPIALTNRDVSRVTRAASSEVPGQVPMKVEVKPSADGTPAQVGTPWSGTVISTARIDGKTSVTLEHGPGLRSTMIFDGVAKAGIEKGARIEKGGAVGVLSPDARSFFWNVSRAPQSALTGPGTTRVSSMGQEAVSGSGVSLDTSATKSGARGNDEGNASVERDPDSGPGAAESASGLNSEAGTGNVTAKGEAGSGPGTL